MSKDKLEKVEIVRHSAAHVLADAVLELFPGAKHAIGPIIDNGFYQDFELPRTLIPEDLPLIEEKMREIIKANISFDREEVSTKNAKDIFSEGKQDYKVEMIEDLEKEGEKKVSIYRTGKFTDLCKGPHVDSSGEINPKAFKLTHISGAYWKGDEKNKMLQRIYGTAFLDPKALRQHLAMLEEAKKRDHRKIGKELELFAFAKEIGPGLPIWLPKGSIIKEEIENWSKETERKWGYDRISTPILTKRKLFEMSGHVPYFENEMYKAQVPGDTEEEYFIRPMNCPFAHMAYKSKLRSYKDLPLKLAEYGAVLRYEDQGAINGMMRPRYFTQNDAHIYCTEEQAVDEFVEIINLHKYYYDTLGLKDYYIVLELRDPKKKDKYHGDEEMWEKSEKYSKEAMDKAGIKYKVVDEGAAHYGPKMDFKVKSVIGTEYGISTNQIDFYMPKRFDLKYKDKDGKEKYVVVQHRAPLGSHERFIGFLIEHFAGAFPLWLSPVQVGIIPVSDKFIGDAQKLDEQLKENDIRTEIDDRTESVGKKISDSIKQKTPYVIVIGEKEAGGKKLPIRIRGQKEIKEVKVDKFIEETKSKIDEKSLEL